MTISGANGSEARTTHGATVPSSGPGATGGVIEELPLDTVHDPLHPPGAVTGRESPASFNQTFRVDDSPTGWWVTPYYFGIDQGPVALMIENHRSGLVWEIMRRCLPIVAGLRRAGFTGGWL
jgi:hypothetical protein